MNAFSLPWLELSVLLPLVGGVWVCLARTPSAAARWCLGFTGAVFGCTLMAVGGFYSGLGQAGSPWDLAHLTGWRVLAVDELSAPLLPLVALLHFLTTLATARTKMVRFSFTWTLVGEALRLAAFACADNGALVALLAVGTLTPYFEMRRRGRPTRVYAIHMGLFVALLGGGWAVVNGFTPLGTDAGAVLLLAAVLVRSGAVPAHVWVTDLFENCSFGTALLFATPIAGVYAAVRLVLPVAPDWVLQGLGLVSLVTAVYAAGMAVVQQDARRFFAFLFLSHASLVMVGLELHTSISLTGALALWFSVALSLSGLGLTLRALEARLGRLTLTSFRGLYDQSPSLAVCFMLTGLASVGFPGTLGYVAAELLVDGAVDVNPVVGVIVIVTAAINGIAIVRVYFLLFTGGRHSTGVSLSITGRERFAVLTLAALIIGGGLVPQFHIESRHRAAEALLASRDAGTGVPPGQHSH
ncbi:MAG: nuoM 1 [Gemmataceae bacterium]|nr:nuoM 1 [Gemmataceae bacterium]